MTERDLGSDKMPLAAAGAMGKLGDNEPVSANIGIKDGDTQQPDTSGSFQRKYCCVFIL